MMNSIPPEYPRTILNRGFRRGLMWTMSCLAFLFLLGAITLFSITYRSQKNDSTLTEVEDRSPAHKIVIFMISDGLGPAGISLTREYMNTTKASNKYLMDSLDSMLVGASITRSKNDAVTDSAAAGTALACGLSVPNGHVAMGEDLKPCKTVLERAKEKGYLTGVVTTSGIVDGNTEINQDDRDNMCSHTIATPATFTSHVKSRVLRDLISLQQLGAGEMNTNAADLLAGGGGCFFKSNCRGRDNSYREDNIRIEDVIKKRGWSVKLGRSFVDKVFNPINGQLSPSNSSYNEMSLPLLNLVVDDYYMSYEIDRNPAKEPSIVEMSRAALTFLKSKLNNTHKGIFLVIEGGRIDIAAHSGDASALLHDIIAYLEAVHYVKKFVEENKGAILVSVSDHETGGLTLNSRYIGGIKQPGNTNWNPEPLTKIKKSFEEIGYDIIEKKKAGHYDTNYIKNTVLSQYLGIVKPEQEFIDSLLNLKQDPKLAEIYQILSKIVAKVTDITWSTTHHTSVDTFVYAYGKDQYRAKLSGVHPSTYIGDVMASIL